MAAPVVASSAYLQYSDEPAVIPVPSGVTSGSLIVVGVFGDWGNITASALLGIGGAFTSSGFTVGPETSAKFSNFAFYLGYFYKYATGADTGNYTFTAQTVGGSTAVNGVSGFALRITGGTSSGNPFVDTARSANAHATSVTVATFTPGGNDSLLLAQYVNESGGTRTFPSGWTGVINDAGAGNALGTLAQSTAAATGSLVFSSTENDSSAVLIATIRPAGAIPVTVNATPMTMTVVVPAPIISTSNSVTVAAAPATATMTFKTPNVSVGGKYLTAVSANKRYFVDQYGDPFLYRQECAWFMPGEDPARWPTYFASRKSYGINVIEIAGISTNNDGTPSASGIAMLDPSDGLPLNLNAEWLVNVRAFVDMAATYGMSVITSIGYGWEGMDGWTGVSDFVDMLVTYFGDASNINLWSFGVDYNPPDWPTYNATAIAVADALKVAKPNWMTSVQNYNPSVSSTNTDWIGHIDFESGYSYQPAYDIARTGYAGNRGPVVMVESNFENENNQGGPATTDLTIRRTAGWMVTNGGVGTDYGIHGLYDPVRLSWESNWETLLPSTALGEQQQMMDAVGTISWWKLVPDVSNAFLTSGQGTKPTSGTQTGTMGDSPVDPLESSYATASVAADGSTALIYLPTSRAITVDLSKLGTSPSAVKVDTTTGTQTALTITGGSISAPGNNASGDSDWLYLFTATPALTASVAAPTMTLTVYAPIPGVSASGGDVPTLLAAYNFDEASGDALDCSGSGHDVTMDDGNRVAAPDGHTGGGVGSVSSLTELAGGTSGVPISTYETTSRSASWWGQVYNTGATSYQMVGWFQDDIPHNSQPVLSIGIGATSATLRMTGADGTTKIGASVTYTSGWHHFACTYDRTTGTGRAYMDGVLKDTITFTSPQDLIASEVIVLDMNGVPGGGVLIDDVRLYNTAIDTTQIAADMASPPVTPTPPGTVIAVPMATTLHMSAPTVAASRKAVAAYNFDEGSGTVAHDVSGNGHTLTVVSSGWTASGHTSNALHYTGSATALVSGATFGSASLTERTLMAWVYVASAPASNPLDIVATGRSGSIFNNLYVYADGTSWGPGCYDSGTSKDVSTTSPTVATGTWHHVAATTSSSGGTNVYLDGALVASDATATVVRGLTDGSIGSPNAGANTWDVRIDDVRIFDYALSGDEITAYMSAPLVGDLVIATPPMTLMATLHAPVIVTAGTTLLAAYNFDEGSGNTILDLSGSGRDVTTTSYVRTVGHTNNAAGPITILMSDNGTTGHVGFPVYTDSVKAFSAWVYYDATVLTNSSFPIMFADIVTSRAEFGFYADGSNNVSFRIRTSDANPHGDGFISAVNSVGWHHWALSYDAGGTGEYQAWWDGEELYGAPLPTLSLPILSTANDVLMTDTMGDGWRVDDLRVYGTALTTAQVLHDMSNPVGGAVGINAAAAHITIAMPNPVVSATTMANVAAVPAQLVLAMPNPGVNAGTAGAVVAVRAQLVLAMPSPVVEADVAVQVLPGRFSVQMAMPFPSLAIGTPTTVIATKAAITISMPQSIVITGGVGVTMSPSAMSLTVHLPTPGVHASDGTSHGPNVVAGGVEYPTDWTVVVGGIELPVAWSVVQGGTEIDF